MTNLLIVEPMPFAAASSRGSGAANLASADPKEVWADTVSGSGATLTIDLGSVRTVDTIFLGYISMPAAAATWAITAGVAGANEQVLQAATGLRVPDVGGGFSINSHALWTGAAANVRFIAITLMQPADKPALMAGALVIGSAFTAELNHEWGAGRRPIDMSSVTSLPSGGFAVVEGARKKAFTWTFGDLSTDEVDRLDALALELGASLPALVVEDADRTSGLIARIHYGLFKWRAFERRNRVQTRWEMEIEQWV